MKMKPTATFSLDLRRKAVPFIPRKAVSGFAETPLPISGFDSQRGLRFPLPPGPALIYPGDGRISDVRGAIRLTFAFDTEDAGGQLMESWAGYLRLSARRSGGQMELELFAYGHYLRMLVPCRCQVVYTLAIDWDCRSGLLLSLYDHTTLLRMTGRTIQWHAYRQTYIPISIGGKLADTRPVDRHWINTFCGWILQVNCFNRPIAVPGAPPDLEIQERGQTPTKTTALPLPDGVTVVELHDPPISDSPLRFDLIPDRLANLKQCGTLHPELAERYHSAPNAFEGLLEVGRFIGNLWPHTEYWPWPREIFTERGDVLLSHIKAGQTAGMCGGFAHVMEEALWALGVPARRAQVWHHSSLEAYDHSHDKWICLEADNHVGHAGCWLAPDGTPYCIGELIDILERDRHEPGIAYELIRFQPLGIACPSGIDNGPSPFWWLRSCYVMMAYSRRRDYGDTTPAQAYAYATPAVRIDPQDLGLPPGWRIQPRNWRDLYWSCDRLQVRTRWLKSHHALQLTLEPFQAQFFAGCEARVDGGKPRRIGKDFIWQLHPGENRIELATLNKLGGRGHPWRCTLAIPGKIL